MKEVYVLRHGEKDSDGLLTDQGQKAASMLKSSLPSFIRVIASPSARTQMTASLASGFEPEIDERAGYVEATQEKIDEISKLSDQLGISFFEATDLYEDNELRESIINKAMEFNELIDDTLHFLGADETALIVSHDLTIAPAMALRGQPRQSLPYLCGYIVAEDTEIRSFDANMPTS